MRKSLRIILATLAVAVVGATAVASPASAATPRTAIGHSSLSLGTIVLHAPVHALAAASTACGSRCNGQDPNTYPVSYCGYACYRTCAQDAYTVSSIWHGSEFLELRYSPYCETIWIRSNAYQSPDDVIGGALTVYPYGASWPILHEAYLPHSNGTRWSVMFDDHGVCGQGQLYAGGTAYGFTTCY